jgi:hypothetical protein
MAKEKGLTTGKIVGLIFFILLWIAGVYWLKQKQTNQIIREPPPPEPPIRATITPTPEPEENSETYLSEELSLKFNYPENWLTNEANGFISIYNYNPEEAPQREYVPETDGDLFKVEMFTDDDFSDIDLWLENQLDQVDPFTGKTTEIFNREELEIDGQKAIFYETENSMTGLAVGNVHIETPENELLHIYGQLNYPDHTEDFARIYQSVEFTD